MLKNKGSMRGGGSGARYGLNTGDFNTKSLKSPVTLERSPTYGSKKRSENASTSTTKGKDPKFALHSPPGDIDSEEQNEMVESAAELLYGLIHLRYILTSKGLNAMLEKYKRVDFGRCPRVCCGGQPCLPASQSDIPRQGTVKIYCPKCEDLYYPRSKYQINIDGAYFGTTFPHLFLMTYPTVKPPKPVQTYVPRVYGFKLHQSAR